MRERAAPRANSMPRHEQPGATRLQLVMHCFSALGMLPKPFHSQTFPSHLPRARPVPAQMRADVQSARAPTSLSDLGQDELEHVASFLTPFELMSATAVSTQMRAAVLSPAVWNGHALALAETRDGLELPSRTEGECEHGYFGRCIQAAWAHDAACELQFVDDFHAKKLVHLRKVADVLEPGTPAASVTFIEEPTLPVPAVLALELVQALSKVPVAKGGGGGDSKIAELLGRKGSYDAVKRLRENAERIGKRRDPAAMLALLKRPFLEGDGRFKRHERSEPAPSAPTGAVESAPPLPPLRRARRSRGGARPRSAGCATSATRCERRTRRSSRRTSTSSRSSRTSRRRTPSIVS